MRRMIIIVLLVTLFNTYSYSQNVALPKFTQVPDSETVVLKGYINRAVIESDTAFKWFGENIKYGTADADAVQAFKANVDNFSLVVFGGTWCHDTQNLLPVFYRLVDKSGFPDAKITLVALDRDKKSNDNLTEFYKVTNVPTFIVIRDGKEIGRVVEYGKTGQIDKELGDIVRKG